MIKVSVGVGCNGIQVDTAAALPLQMVALLVCGANRAKVNVE